MVRNLFMWCLVKHLQTLKLKIYLGCNGNVFFLSTRIHVSDLDVIKMCPVCFESRTLPIRVPDCVRCTH